jgi:hypothetical protein
MLVPSHRELGRRIRMIERSGRMHTMIHILVSSLNDNNYKAPQALLSKNLKRRFHKC